MTALSDTQATVRSRIVVCLAIAWLVGFAFVFFQLELPNAPVRADGTRVSRSEIWSLLPDLLLYTVVEHPELIDDPQATPSGWRFFPQRLPFIAVGVVILFGAYGLGSLILRTAKLNADLRACECLVFAFGLGLSGLSLMTLGLGLLAQVVPGAMSRGVLGMLTLLPGILGTWLQWRGRRNRISETKTFSSTSALKPAMLDSIVRGQIAYGTLMRTAALFAMVLFVLAMALGAMLPSIDFDVKEYHLQGPKEHFQAGHVSLLPHNVYTSFPFLTEMITLLAMVLSGDWFAGALAGKLVLMSFAPLTALGVFAAANRWFSNEAAWAAALIHLSTPWTYRISVIAYAEGGLTFYLLATLLAVMLTVKGEAANRRGRLLLCGLLAGSAMACKYPGVVSVVLPLGFVLLGDAWKLGNGPDQVRSVLRTGLLYSCGVLIAIGPWLTKNLVEAGNPFYPLLNSIFDGADWTPTLEANWKAAHSPSDHNPADIPVKLFDVTFKSDWLSPLLFSLAPLALLVKSNRRLTGWLWAFVGYQFLSWWVLTHRIDRFWVPLIPVVSLLGGAGFCWSRDRLWRWGAGAIIFLSVLFNLGFLTTGNCGFNLWLAEITAASRQAASTAPGISALNERDDVDSLKVLCVGEAQVFDARFPVIYNTVFDISIFEMWCSANDSGVAPSDQPMRSVDDIRAEMQREQVTHVLVNWQEILRYRMTYGYTEFVSPRRFTDLQRSGLLAPDPSFRVGVSDFDSLRADEQADVTKWAPELIVEQGGIRYFITSQLFVVRE